MRRIAAAVIALGIAGSGLTASATSSIDVSSIRLEFSSSDDVGVAAAAGFSHRYTNIMPGSGHSIDARVTILGITNLESEANSDASAATPDNKTEKLDDFDSDANDNKDIQLETDIFGTSGDPATGYIVFRIEFLESGSLVPVVLNNVSLHVTDIDSQQFVQTSGINSYRLTSTSKLTVKTNAEDSSIPAGSYRFVAPATSSSSSDPDASDFWAEVTVNEASYLDFTVGAFEGGSASFNLVFSKADWTGLAAVDTSPPAPTYVVTYDGNTSTAGTPPTSQSSSSFVTVSDNTGALVKPGYEFIGWNSAADGTGLVVGPKEQFRPTSNITLYAQWKAVATTTTVPATSEPSVGEEAIGAESLSSAGMSATLLVTLGVCAVLVGFRLRRPVSNRR